MECVIGNKRLIIIKTIKIERLPNTRHHSLYKYETSSFSTKKKTYSKIIKYNKNFYHKFLTKKSTIKIRNNVYQY